MDTFNYTDTLTSDDLSSFLDSKGELSTMRVASTPNDFYDRETHEMLCQPRTYWRELGARCNAWLDKKNAIGRDVEIDVDDLAAKARVDALKRAKAVVEACTQLPPDQLSPVSSPMFSDDGKVGHSPKQQSEQVA